jgi:hypothetical protein
MSNTPGVGWEVRERDHTDERENNTATLISKTSFLFGKDIFEFFETSQLWAPSTTLPTLTCRAQRAHP